MKEGYHKHKGAKKAHPVSREHRSHKVKQFHDEELKARGVKVEQPKSRVDVREEVDVEEARTKVDITSLNVPVDKEGYLSLDLDSAPVNGLKLTFRRAERGKVQEVSMKFENGHLSSPRRKHVSMQEEL